MSSVDASDSADGDGDAAGAWELPIVETVATKGEGIEAFVAAIEDHLAHLDETGERTACRRERHADAIQQVLREETRSIAAEAVELRGGVDELAARVLAGETDPYTAAEEILSPIEDCLDEGSLDEPGPDED